MSAPDLLDDVLAIISDPSFSPSTISASGYAEDTDTLLISTSDDQIIPVPRSLLFRHCRFLQELPPLLDSESPDEPFPLPSASSAGLRFLIDLLLVRESQKESKYLPRLPWHLIDINNLQTFVDAMTIADAYDIPAFGKIINDPIFTYALRSLHPPLSVWAISALSGVRHDPRRFILETLLPVPNTLPPNARSILLQQCPLALHTLESDQERWLDMAYKLRNALTNPKSRSLTPETDPNQDRYTARCEGRSPWLGWPCSARAQTRDWNVLRSNTGMPVFEAVAKSRGGIKGATIDDVIMRQIKCKRCTKRLMEIYAPAISEFVQECPKDCREGRTTWQPLSGEKCQRASVWDEV